MSADEHLKLFAHLLGRHEASLDLGRAALLLAEPEYPSLDIPGALQELDTLAAEARLKLGWSPSLEALSGWLHDEAGFRGNVDDYYDARNSFLNEVLSRRTGIPISLAVVHIEVARRLEVTAEGVSFPGHFLIRGDGKIYVDPFTGRVCGPAELRRLYARSTGQDRAPDESAYEIAGKTQILLRMLNNLRGIYAAANDGPRLRLCLDRVQILTQAQKSAPKAGAPRRPVIRSN